VVQLFLGSGGGSIDRRAAWDFNRDRGDQLIHEPGGFILALRHEVPVDIQGGAGFGMPQSLGNHDGGDIAVEH
jgi:hypothetical protein